MDLLSSEQRGLYTTLELRIPGKKKIDSYVSHGESGGTL